MVDINKMARMSGERSEAPRYELPIVRLDGREGKFYKIVKDEGSSETQKIELAGVIKGTPLKFRRVLNSFTDEVSFFTNEHNTWKDIVTLFERREGKNGSKIQMVDTASVGELREKYQDLKMVQIIYFLEENGEIVKLQVKGKGLSNLFEFMKEMKDESKGHMFEYLLSIGIKEEEGKLGTFYSMTFETDKKIEKLDDVAAKMEEVSSKLLEIDEYFKAQTPPATVDKDIPEKEDIPVIVEGESTTSAKKPKKVKDEEEEIDVKDIPY